MIGNRCGGLEVSTKQIGSLSLLDHSVCFVRGGSFGPANVFVNGVDLFNLLSFPLEERLGEKLNGGIVICVFLEIGTS